MARALTHSAASATDDILASFDFRRVTKKPGSANLAQAVGGRLVKIKSQYEITKEDVRS